MDVDQEKTKQLYNELINSDKVSDFIKSLEVEEIFSFYQLIDSNNKLTNLGVLWLGNPIQRARLHYPLTIQYIVYNEIGEKVRKKEWHFNMFNPKELLLEIEKEAVELTYSTEIPDGLFRKTIRQYPKEIIRELIVNAIAHKKYTISGDIFIEVFPEYLKITNPGGLPLGITEDNILHERQRRNPHLIKLMSDLKLMEGEGSGFDLVYEKLARDAKPLPEIESSITKVSVTIFSGSVNREVISILDYIDKHFTLSQKEYITLGIVATEKKVLATQLATRLQLTQEDRLRSWIGSLMDKSILVTQGERKGTSYLLNPKLFEQAKVDITPSLKTIEPYKLEALIKEDLLYNGESRLNDIQNRLKEIPSRDVQKTVYKLASDGVLLKTGAKKNRRYKLVKNK